MSEKTLTVQTDKWMGLLKFVISMLIAGGFGAGAAKVTNDEAGSRQPACPAEIAVLRQRVDNLSEMKSDVKELRREMRELSEDVAELVGYLNTKRKRR